MGKAKLNVTKEVTKIWQEAKENLRKLGQKTLTLAQKGQQEVVLASKIGKLQLEIVSINLMKENVFRQIGKKTYEITAGKDQIDTTKLKSLFDKIGKLNRQIKVKKAQIAHLNKDRLNIAEKE